jgi:hypothetical protein
MMRICHLNGDGTLRNSLTAIKQAHIQLHVLTGMRPSPTVLASQIKLCDMLLIEISGIRSNLAREISNRRVDLREPVAMLD